MQLQLFFDYGSNPPLYPAWQAYCRLVVGLTSIQAFRIWGCNTFI